MGEAAAFYFDHPGVHDAESREGPETHPHVFADSRQWVSAQVQNMKFVKVFKGLGLNDGDFIVAQVKAGTPGNSMEYPPGEVTDVVAAQINFCGFFG